MHLCLNCSCCWWSAIQNGWNQSSSAFTLLPLFVFPVVPHPALLLLSKIFPLPPHHYVTVLFCMIRECTNKFPKMWVILSLKTIWTVQPTYFEGRVINGKVIAAHNELFETNDGGESQGHLIDLLPTPSVFLGCTRISNETCSNHYTGWFFSSLVPPLKVPSTKKLI